MYNNNYLLQMNEDLNFLKDSTLGKYLYLGEKKSMHFLPIALN